MSLLRLWVIGAVFVSLLVLGLGYLLGVAPRLAEAAAADSERQDVELVNVGYEATLLELQQLSENLPALEAELAALREEIPEAPELSTLLGQLNDLAEAAGVEISEVTANAPVLFPAELLEGTGVTDLVAVPIRVSAAGGNLELSEFLSSIQFGQRLLLVERFDITEDPTAARLNFDGFIFVLPPEGAFLPTDEVGDAPAGEAPAEAPVEAPAEEPAEETEG